ncbi:RP671a family tick cell line-upregulated protein [Rickettsia sp. 2024-CO-Wats]|uniref:RP671a family tick cell line-upregulated protein n=1 Tax=unclassified Rickettsia TaxID=114295 RepID=UPI00370D1EE0
MENTTEEQTIISEVKNNEDIDEEEKRLKVEDSRKQLKAILITFGIILTSFLTFTYFFFNYIEEKAEEYKQQQQQEIQKTNKR